METAFPRSNQEINYYANVGLLDEWEKQLKLPKKLSIYVAFLASENQRKYENLKNVIAKNQNEKPFFF